MGTADDLLVTLSRRKDANIEIVAEVCKKVRRASTIVTSVGFFDDFGGFSRDFDELCISTIGGRPLAILPLVRRKLV